MRTEVFQYTIDWGFCEPETHNLYLTTDSYESGGGLAVIVMEVDENGNEEMFDVITVNLPFGWAGENQAYIDTNNCSWAEKMLKKMKLAKPTGDYCGSGYCKYPLYEFNLKKFNK